MDFIYHGCMTENADAWVIAEGQLILLVLFLAHIPLFIVYNGYNVWNRLNEIFKKKIQ